MPGKRPDLDQLESNLTSREQAIRKLEHVLDQLRNQNTELVDGHASIDRTPMFQHDADLDRDVPVTIRDDGGDIEIVPRAESGVVVIEYNYSVGGSDADQSTTSNVS